MNNLKVMILSEVLEFIENEVRKIDEDLETGGLLLGTKQEDGSRIVTHAFPPGPKAIHHPTMFERDLEFSQTALNYFFNKSNVEYVGEWHKHPSGVTRPSGGDRIGVINILKDKDYKTGGVMVFPIFVLEPKSSYSIDRKQKAVKIYPYYMDRSRTDFKIFTFQIANCNIGIQEEVKKFHENYLIFKGVKKGNLTLSSHYENREMIKTQDNLTLYKYIFNSIDKIKDSLVNFFDEKITSPSLRKVNEIDDSTVTSTNLKSKEDEKETEEVKQEIPWYKTVSGKKILASENLLVKEIDSFKSVNVLEDGSLIFRFEPQNTIFIKLDIVCQEKHPNSFPKIIIKTDHYDGELPNEQEQALKKLSMEVNELRNKWDSKEIDSIAEISRKLIETGNIDEEERVITESQDISQREWENADSNEKKWYDTINGKKILNEETILLRQSGLDYQIKKLQNKQLVITINNFIVNNKKYKIEAVFPDSYPEQIPDIYIKKGGEDNKAELIKGKDLPLGQKSPFLVKILDDISKMI